MENVFIAILAVLPTLIILIVGYMLKKINILNVENVGGFNTSVANIFLPCLTSSMVLKLDEHEMKDFKLLIFCFISASIICIVGYAFRKFIDSDEKKSISILATRISTNNIILGGSVASSLYGETPPIIGFSTSVSSTFMNFYTIMILELFKNKKISFKTIVSVFKKPIVCAVVISLLIKIISIKIPGVIVETVTTLGKATLPVSLISLGVFFDFKSFGDSIKKILNVCILHYVIGIIVLIVAIFLGFRDERLSSILFIFMSSTAVSTFPLCAEYGMDTKLVGNILISSTILSIIVFSISIYVLKQMMLI